MLCVNPRSIAVSDLCWRGQDDSRAAFLLRNLDVEAVELTLYRDRNPGDRLRLWEEAGKLWRDRGVEVVAARGLLSSRDGLSIFGGEPSRKKLLTYLRSALKACASLGAPLAVYDCPYSRIVPAADNNPGSLAGLLAVAKRFFCRVADLAQSFGVKVAFQALPTCYGGSNFACTTHDAARLVASVDHPALSLAVDTGVLAVEKRLANAVKPDAWRVAGARIGYVTYSGPHYVYDHARQFDDESLAKTLSAAGYVGPLSLLSVPQSDNVRGAVGRLSDMVRAARDRYADWFGK